MASAHPSNCISSVAHSSFLVQTAPNKEGNSQSKIKKLHNIIEKLHNNDELTEAEKRLLFSTSMQDYAYLLDQAACERKVEQHKLDKRNVEALEQWLQLPQLIHDYLIVVKEQQRGKSLNKTFYCKRCLESQGFEQRSIHFRDNL